MSTEYIIALVGAGIVAVSIVVIVAKFSLRRAPLRPRKKSYRAKWQVLQKYCKDPATWPDALIAADKLLDKALVKKGYKGKSTGGRMVSAQKAFSDNDSVWVAHKLYKRIIEDPDTKLKEKEVKSALVAYARALKDLGAL